MGQDFNFEYSDELRVSSIFFYLATPLGRFSQKIIYQIQYIILKTWISLPCNFGSVFQIKSFVSIGCITLLFSRSNDIFWIGKLCKRLQELIIIQYHTTYISCIMSYIRYIIRFRLKK